MLLIQCTVATDELLCLKNAAPMAIENIKILRAVFELPAKQHCQFSPFGPFSRWIGWISRNWQCCVAGSSNGPKDFDFFNCHGCWLFICTYSKALRCTFLGEWKNQCSSKTFYLRSVLFNRVQNLQQSVHWKVSVI